MSFAARAQASHARLRGHFGSVSVVIRQGSAVGATSMTVTSRAPIPQGVGGGGNDESLQNGQQVGDLEIKFDHSDPGRTFVPKSGNWATLNGETYRIVSVSRHQADAVISYTCSLRGSE